MASIHTDADDRIVRRNQRLVGLGVSRGVGRGSVVFLPPGRKPDPRENLDESGVREELLRLERATGIARQQLRDLADDIHSSVSEIFSVQQLILESIVTETEAVIKDKKVNAELAINTVITEVAARQSSIDDPRLREKHLDIEDAAIRLRRAIRGTRTPLSIDPNAIVVARELRPSVVVELAKFKPAGLITEVGGWTSHMAIVAREYHLPMVTGIKNAEKLLAAGDLVMVDGDTGEVLLSAEGHRGEQGERGLVNIRVANTPPAFVRTADGVEIAIRANAENPDAYRSAEVMGARGVGLYRSELLIGDDGIVPDEDTQASAYSEMSRTTGELGVAIRTFDISPEHVSTDSDISQPNPALGLRAIRSGLAQPNLLRTQVRAILRASSYGKVDLILPLISNVDEIKMARSIISSVVSEMKSVGRSVEMPRIGVMIEVPSTVFAARLIAKHVDFLCLGTNDLVQYLLAVDRDNDAVADWYQTLHPAVLSAIQMVLKSAADAGIPTTLCGEMAGSPFYVPVLIGLGARELSLNPNSIRPVIHLLSGLSTNDAASLVSRLSTCETASEIEERLREYYAANWSDLFAPDLLASRHP